ncbi:hypothetical protein E1180_09525 [Roseibium denhamense]|uniref:DUF2345 domain-containing protein n=1 Tax=Roseibium denhamense TaxID=76305 RepID=A0ABY1PLU7_9HYPH|nr:hypothetical protein [Roseibium denhamense]MTI05755.1 hypothetical protein [Roseibium denhamense]SMP36987.1 hypothetical protein SAMN06265374_4424 [Roseibium denhamense]
MSDTDTTSQSQVSYDTKHFYFYLPRLSENEEDVPDNIDLGAIFRLGGYCELEEQAGDVEEDAEHYYPEKHIEDEGGLGSDNIFQHAAGSSPSTSHGILLACDGRILLKAGEKYYLQTADQNIDVEGNYELEVSGNVDVAAEGSVKIESGTNQSITLDAGNETGTIYIQGKEQQTKIMGHSYELITENSYEVVHANRYEFFAGGKVEMVTGGCLEMNLAAVAAISLNAALEMNLFVNISITTLEMSFKKFEFDIAEMKLVSPATKAEMTELETQMHALSSRISDVQVEVNPLKTRAGELEAATQGLKTDLGELRLSTTNAMVAMSGIIANL